MTLKESDEARIEMSSFMQNTVQGKMDLSALQNTVQGKMDLSALQSTVQGKMDLSALQSTVQGKIDLSVLQNAVREKLDPMAAEAARQLQALAHPPVRARIKNTVKKKLGRPGYSGDVIFWPAGLLMLGLLEAGHLEEIEAYLGEWIQKGMPVRNPDDALTGVVLERLYRETGKACYREGAGRILEYLENCRKDSEGSIVYGQRSRNSWIYADGAGQTSMFYAQMGEMEKAGRELCNFARNGMDAASGLPYHGYDAQSGTCYGIIGWGRAVGWLMLGLSACSEIGTRETEQNEDVRAAVGILNAEKKSCCCDETETAHRTKKSSDMQMDTVSSMQKRLIHSILERQREDGLFSWQLDCRKGPADTSASGMIAYALFKGRMLQGDDTGLYDAFAQALLDKVDENGRVQQSSAECVDFAQYRQEYGCNSWGQGAVLAFLAAWSKMDGRDQED